MTKTTIRRAIAFVAVVAAGAFGLADAQLTITDGTPKTGCTSYTVQYSTSSPGTPTISLSPAGCLGTAASTPHFTFAANQTATATEAQALSAGGAYNIQYTVNLERFTNASTLSVTVEACASGTGCTAALVQDYYLEGDGLGQGFPWAPPYRYTLTFAPGETSKTFTMAVADNLLSDGDRTLTFSLINPTGGAVVGTPATQSLVISDNEPPPTTIVAFDVGAPVIAENDPVALAYIGVTRSLGIGTASVKAILQGASTGVAGTNFALDYSWSPFSGTPQSYTLNFASGETSKGFWVRVFDVAGYAGDKTAIFSLQNPVNLIPGVITTTALTIKDKDPPVVLPPGDYDSAGKLIPSTPTHSGPGASMCENFQNFQPSPAYPPSPGIGGAQPCGSYRIPVSGTGYNCSAHRTGTHAVNNAFLYVLEDYQPGSPRLGNSILWGMVRDAAMVFKFKTGAIGSYQSLPHWGSMAWGEQYNRGQIANTTFVSISESKCDFDVPKAAAGGCYRVLGNSGGITLQVTADGSGTSYAQCSLKPDTTYYLNIRYDTEGSPNPAAPYERANSCTNAYCGQYITIN